MVRFGGKRREISRERFWLFRHTTLSLHYYFYTNESIFQLFLLLSLSRSASLSLSKHAKTKTERQRARRNERRAETTLNVVVGIFIINRVCRSTREMRNSHRPSLGSCREGRGVFHRQRAKTSASKNARKKTTSLSARCRGVLRANASSSSSSLKKVSPSSSSFKNNKGENIIVVGLGTRGVTIIDELQEGACLPKAQFWSISSDVGILTRTKSTNRWRLPPATSDIPQSAVIDNATSAAQSVLFAAESMSLEAFSSGGDDDDDKKKSKQEKQKELDEKVHICVVCSSGEAGGEAGMLFAKELFKSKNIASEKKTRFPGIWGGVETPSGSTVSIHAVAPFDFEGRRKRDEGLAFLDMCSRKKGADSVVVVSQRDAQALEGEPMTLEAASALANDFCRWSVLNVAKDLRRNSTFWDARVNGENERCGILDEQNAFKDAISSKTLREINSQNLSKSASGGCGIAVVGCAVEELKTYGTEDEQISAAIVSAVKEAAEDSPFLDPTQALGEKCVHLVCQISTPRGTLGPLARKSITSSLAAYVNPLKCGVTICKAPAENTVGCIEISLYAVANFETIAERFTLRQSQIALRKLKDRNLPEQMINNLEPRKKRLDWSSVDDLVDERNKNKVTSPPPKRSSPQTASDGKSVDSIFDEALMSVDESNESLLRAGDMLANISEDGTMEDAPEINPFVTTDEEFDLESENFVVLEDEDLEVPPPPPPPSSDTEEKQKTTESSAATADAARITVPGELTGSVVLTPVRVLRPKEDASGNVVGYRAVDSVNDYDKADVDDNDIDTQNEKSNSNSKFSLLGWRPFSSKNDASSSSSSSSKVRSRAFGVLESDREARTRPILRVEYANMCVYEGEVLEKTTKAEGSGIMRFASGDWYEGRFAQGKPDGKGKLSFSRGGYFEGEWLNGKPVNGSLVKPPQSPVG